MRCFHHQLRKSVRVCWALAWRFDASHASSLVLLPLLLMCI
jgi:hypothetical protein